MDATSVPDRLTRFNFSLVLLT